MPIGEVARRAGLRTSAIRYYERLGLLPAPPRTSGRRRYEESVLVRLQLIRFARDLGFTIREIRKLLAGQPYAIALRQVASAKVVELEGVITRARTMQSLLKTAVRCQCLTIEECGRRLNGTGRTR